MNVRLGKLGAGLLIIGIVWFAAGLISEPQYRIAGGIVASLGVVLIAAFDDESEGDT